MIRTFLFLSLLLITFSSCQQKNNDTSNGTKAEEDLLKEYLSPIKLDSLLDEKYLLNTYFASIQDEKEFNFVNPIASAKTYESYTDANGKSNDPENPEQLISEIRYNKFGKLNSFENFDDDEKFEINYNSKHQIIYYIYHNTDVYDKIVDEITEFEYFKNGNLKSSYQYEMDKDKNYDFSYYKEYRYSLEGSNIIVDMIELRKSGNFYYTTKQITFDKELRIISENTYTQNSLVGGRLINLETKYSYDNTSFPNKISEKFSKAKSDLSHRIESFYYDSKGRLIEDFERTEPDLSVQTITFNYNDKEKSLEKITDYKQLRDYKVMDMTVKADSKYERTKYIFDSFGNIIYEQPFYKNIKEGKYYTSKSYTLDKKNNWKSKLIKMHSDHSDVPLEERKDFKEDEYVNYRREISYSDYENLFDSKIIEKKSATEFKNAILLENKFEENLKYQ